MVRMPRLCFGRVYLKVYPRGARWKWGIYSNFNWTLIGLGMLSIRAGSMDQHNWTRQCAGYTWHVGLPRELAQGQSSVVIYVHCRKSDCSNNMLDWKFGFVFVYPVSVSPHGVCKWGIMRQWMRTPSVRSTVSPMSRNSREFRCLAQASIHKAHTSISFPRCRHGRVSLILLFFLFILI